MFQLYANLLSIDAKYAWNKIVHKQTQSNPYTDLLGATNARRAGREQRGNLRGGCVSKLCVD